MTSIAQDVKALFSDDLDAQLEVIERRTNSRLSRLIGCDVPTELEYIVFEVTTKRLNRMGNEGMSSYSQEGLSMSFPDSDFTEYEKEIENWKIANGQEDHLGSAEWL